MPGNELQLAANTQLTVPWEEFFGHIYTSPSYAAVIGSGLLLSLGLVGRYMYGLWQLHRGIHPDFFAPILRVILFCLALSHYRDICVGTVRFVATLGDGPWPRASIEQLWEDRRQAYQAHWAQVHEDEQAELAGHDAYVNGGLELVAHLGLIASQAAVLMLRALQLFFLVALFLAGPWLLSLTFLGGPFAAAGWRWIMALIEVSSWSWGMSLLAYCLQRTLSVGAGTPYTLSREITICSVMAGMVACVPWIMGRLWRSEPLVQLSHGVRAYAATTGASIRETLVAQVRAEPSASLVRRPAP